MSIKSLILLACVGHKFIVADGRSDTYFYEEVCSLSQLPMDKLVHIKSTFLDNKQEIPRDRLPPAEDSLDALPIALPLRKPKPKDVRRHDDYYHDDKGKVSKVSKIFHLAVTTLSFFAFGGYLLTLVITALKRNSTGNVIVLQSLQSLKRPKRDAFFYNPMENDYDTERLYKGMIMLSESYAMYN